MRTEDMARAVEDDLDAVDEALDFAYTARKDGETKDAKFHLVRAAVLIQRAALHRALVMDSRARGASWIDSVFPGIGGPVPYRETPQVGRSRAAVDGATVGAAWGELQEALPQGWRVAGVWLRGPAWTAEVIGPDGARLGAGGRDSPHGALLALATDVRSDIDPGSPLAGRRP